MPNLIGGSSAGTQWWVITRAGAVARGAPMFAVVSAVGKPVLQPGQTIAAGPFSTQAQAQAWITNQNVPQPTLPNPFGGITGIGDFFGRLTEASTWIRVGEVVVGIIALGIGLYVVVKDTDAAKATKKVASTASTLAFPEAKAASATAKAARRSGNYRTRNISVTKG